MENTPTPKINVAIAACTGQMGRTLIETCLSNLNPNAILSAAFARESSAYQGKDAATLCALPSSDILIESDLIASNKAIDVIVDFSLPSHTLENLHAALERNCAFVSGTTGLTKADLDLMQTAAKDIPILHAPNMSVAMQLMYDLIKKAAAVLGPDYDIEIIEAHHNKKVDAPSGAALKMGEIIANTLDLDLQKVAVYDRHDRTQKRQAKEIGFSSIRAGSIVGEHTVVFAGPYDRFEITHKASSRQVFAQGAIKAATWLAQQKPGFYGLADMVA